jgi:hypothetical protein
MGKKASIVQIKESLQELHSKKSQQTTLPMQKRILALIRLKSNHDETRQDLANSLFISKRTLERWITTYVESGMKGLLKEHTRVKNSKIISEDIHKGLGERVNDPKKAFKSYGDAQAWVESEYGVRITYHWLRKYMIKHFKTRVKRPRKSHVNKDDKAVAFFKNATRTAKT